MTINTNQFGVESWISPGTAAGGNAAGGGTATGAGGISSESCGRPIPSPGVFEAVFGTSSFSGLGAGAAGAGAGAGATGALSTGTVSTDGRAATLAGSFHFIPVSFA